MRRSSTPDDVEAPPKVVDLMEALRRSLDQVSSGKKKTAKAAPVAAKKVTNIKAGKTAAAKKRKASLSGRPKEGHGSDGEEGSVGHL